MSKLRLESNIPAPPQPFTGRPKPHRRALPKPWRETQPLDSDTFIVLNTATARPALEETPHPAQAHLAGRAVLHRAAPDGRSPPPPRSPRPPGRHRRRRFSNPANGGARRRAACWARGGGRCAEGPDGKCSRGGPGRAWLRRGGVLSGSGCEPVFAEASRKRGKAVRTHGAFTHPEPSGPVPSAAAGRRPGLAALPRGLPSPARVALCSARALAVGLEDICKFKLVDTPGDYRDARSPGVLQAGRQAEALRATYKRDNSCLQVVKGKRSGDLLNPQMPCIRAAMSRIGKLLFLSLGYSCFTPWVTLLIKWQL